MLLVLTVENMQRQQTQQEQTLLTHRRTSTSTMTQKYLQQIHFEQYKLFNFRCNAIFRNQTHLFYGLKKLFFLCFSLLVNNIPAV